MKGFRRAQLRGSDELFRATDGGTAEQEPLSVEVPEAVHPVPAAPDPTQRSVRLSAADIELLADAVQHLKFPQQSGARPSMERFEQLETLRQRLLGSL
ncbi:MAG: hypothetical protein ACYDAC_01840 [Candidatus Dormibacteria bacterium]